MMEDAAASGGAAPERFRWQALFQRVDEPLFVLNRRRVILFVNHAWQRLTGLSPIEARRVACRRRRPVAVADSTNEILAHLLCPPAEVLAGESSRVRRLLPGRGTSPRWWDIDFFPLCHEAHVLGILGRILPLPAKPAAGTPPLPEKLAALRTQALRLEHQHLPAGVVPSMRRLLEQMQLASQVRTSAVLVGEPGSGKKTLARLIHARGLDRERSFAALDCVRLPAVAVASLLLGDAGAEQRRQLGTVYLEEPGRLPRELQQILWERLTERDDEEEAVPDRLPRLLAGFSGEPREQVRSGRLLENLYCTMEVIRLEVPSLRERLLDFPVLVDRMLARAQADAQRTIEGLSAEAWELLRQHQWPGNLRELFAVLDAACQRATTAGDARKVNLELADLPASLRRQETTGRAPERSLDLDQVLEEVERRLIRLTVQRTKGNRSKAADLLGMSRPRLLRRMEALGLSSAAAEADEE
jgi:transcriptional regulator with AAA-type ATPase domain